MEACWSKLEGVFRKAEEKGTIMQGNANKINILNGLKSCQEQIIIPTETVVVNY